VTEKKGALKLYAIGGKQGDVSGVPTVDYGGQGGLGDVVLHPDFAANNLGKRRERCPSRWLFDSPVTRKGRAVRATVPGVFWGSKAPENFRLRRACRCLTE
jgi:hypothetical protein